MYVFGFMSSKIKDSLAALSHWKRAVRFCSCFLALQNLWFNPNWLNYRASFGGWTACSCSLAVVGDTWAKVQTQSEWVTSVFDSCVLFWHNRESAWAHTCRVEHTMHKECILFFTHFCKFMPSFRTGCAVATPNTSTIDERQKLEHWVCKEPSKRIIRMYRWEVFREWIMHTHAPRAFLFPPNGLTTQRHCRIVCDWGWSHPSTILVFHVCYITDRRVIKADDNVQPFPLLLSCRPTGRNCTPM